MTSKTFGDEVANAIDASGSGPADYIAPIGTTSNLSALVITPATLTNSAATFVDGAQPTGAEVDTAITASQAKVITALALKADNADVETLRTQVEARLDAIEAKIDAILAKLVAASLMASS